MHEFIKVMVRVAHFRSFGTWILEIFKINEILILISKSCSSRSLRGKKWNADLADDADYHRFLLGRNEIKGF